jgi:hypothetical protein
MATEYGTTPAAQVGVDDVLLAFCVNRACFWAGSQQSEVKAMNMG